MHAISGNLACQVAAFVYKDDQTAIGAWRDVQQISDIRGEIHDSRASFLSALKAWNDRPELNPDNAFLGIYAHMGSPGISPKSGLDPTFNPADVISWSDLAAALPLGVSTCWLVGCSSVEVTAVWDPVAGPVLRRLLVTQEGNRWLPLLKHFAVEIGIARNPGRVDLGGCPPRSPTDPDLRLIKPPLSQCLIPDPGRMDIGDQDLKTDNLLHDDVCAADLLERESAMSFHSRRRSRPSAQTTHRPRGGTCRERTQPRSAQMRSLSTGI